MKRVTLLLKKLIPSVLQIIFVVALLVTAFVAYNLGAESSSGAESVSPVSESASTSTKGRETIYTCSMHPQIRQIEPGDCPICGMELVPAERTSNTDHDSHGASGEPKLLGYACAMNCVPPLEEPGNCPVCGMEMQPVYEEAHEESGQEMVDPTRRMTMTREAVALASIQTTRVTSEVPRKSVRLVGELALDPSRRAHISTDVGGRIDRLTADYEGDVVQKGQELVLLYSPELLAVQQEYLQARKTLDRISDSAIDNIREASERVVESARERLRLAGLSYDQIDAIAEEGKAREQVVLDAPISGTVVALHAEEGEYISKGERIVTIADLSVLWAEMAAYESDLPWLKVGQQVTFTAESFPGQTFEGEVAWIDPMTDPRTRTTRVRLNVDNESGLLRPGMYLTGLVDSVLSDQPMLIIPESAPLITGTRAVVYTSGPNMERPAFQGVDVTLGPRVKDGYIVLDGLEEGQHVVTNGAFQIDSALQIIARPSMMNPSGGVAIAGHDHDQGMAMSNPVKDLPEQPADFLGKIIVAYLAAQRALAADDPATASDAFQQLANTAAQVNMVEVRMPAKEGQEAESIDGQREAFQRISNHLIPLVREHGNPTESPLRLVHCLMAFDFEGADWLQTEAEVQNPYFGDEMLTCGSIRQEWTNHD